MSDTTAAALVRTFRTACGLPIGTRPRLIPQHRTDLHADLLAEEVGEYADAARLGETSHIARELADVVIVAHGAALDHGIDLGPVITEVMAANLRKVVDGKVTKRDDGKILKPAGWVGPDVAGVLARQVDTTNAAAAEQPALMSMTVREERLELDKMRGSLRVAPQRISAPRGSRVLGVRRLRAEEEAPAHSTAPVRLVIATPTAESGHKLPEQPMWTVKVHLGWWPSQIDADAQIFTTQVTRASEVPVGKQWEDVIVQVTSIEEATP